MNLVDEYLEIEALVLAGDPANDPIAFNRLSEAWDRLTAEDREFLASRGLG